MSKEQICEVRVFVYIRNYSRYTYTNASLPYCFIVPKGIVVPTYHRTIDAIFVLSYIKMLWLIVKISPKKGADENKL